MIKLFLLKNPSAYGEMDEKTLALSDSGHADRALSLPTPEKRAEALSAGVILPLALKSCGISGKIKIERGEWGKPLLVQPKGLHFNLSHSGGYTLLALADCEVGCDIQKSKPVDLRLAERYFTAEEAAEIFGAGDGAADLFFRYWTVKESYLKALGCGLSRPLNSFTVRFTDEGVTIADPLLKTRFSVKEYPALDGFKIACCAANGDFCEELTELKI